MNADPAPAARRLADRLVVEGVAAEAEASSVRVRPECWARAVVLAEVFGDVDAGRSRVAPAPVSSWNGAWWRELVAALALGLIIIPAVALALLAIAG